MYMSRDALHGHIFQWRVVFGWPLIQTVYKKTTGADDVKARYRRQNNKLTRCPVSLVADYQLFSVIGRHDTSTTVKYMVRAGR